MTIVPDTETRNTDRVSEEEAHESENKVIGGAEIYQCRYEPY